MKPEIRKKVKMKQKVSLKRKMLLLLAAGLLTAGVGVQKEASAQRQMQQEIAEKVIRFHVRANSDTQEDQSLKLFVRDAVGAYMQPYLAGADSVEEGRRIVEKELSGVTECAQRAVEACGYPYEVSARLTRTDFPEKTYGEYVFPAGRYEALEVVIGEGEGQNWWCVMYPNMCFFNSVYEVVDEEAKRSLKGALTTEEYESLMEHKDYEVKFALLDFWEDIKEAVAISH